ncbi:MAG: hypothetical protein K1X83_11610 [Oligoflexia bacterium]|nr:hypothetical protein [Oligoflexia bacterium]
MKKFMFVLVVLLASSGVGLAEELKDIFGRVEQYVAAKNYTKALDELSWAKKEIEKLNSGQLKTFFPDELAGFTGDKIESQNMFGITGMERLYKKSGANTTVKVSLTGGAGGAAGGLGGLAALGSFAAMMGQQQGQDTFRIEGRTATLEEHADSHAAELTVFLNSGSILKLEMQNGTDAAVLKQMAENLKLNDLDAYLKGAS